MANICVFSSANHDIDGVYKRDARRLGELIGLGRHTLVYGGTRNGLMGVLQRATQRNGGFIRGIVADRFKEYARPADIRVHDLHERLSVMNMNSDAFVALAGGIGTMHEILDVMASRQAGYHNKPIALVNTLGFYDDLHSMFKRLERNKMIKGSSDDFYRLCSSPDEAYGYVTSATTPDPVLG